MSEFDLTEEVKCGFTVTAKRKAVWRKELELVEEFIRICDKYGLEYFISGGTLLGAVRHRGFIPWDDDIDIMMRRSAYEKFISVCKQELKDGYFLQHYTIQNNYFCGHAQIRDSSTTALLLEDYDNLKTNKNLGIFIDIFPFDNIPDGDAAAKRFTDKIKHRKKVITSKICSKNYRGFRGILKRLYFAMFVRDNEKYIAKTDKLAQKYNGKTDRVALTTFLPGYKGNIWNSEWFEETTVLPFENLVVNAPKAYDQVLRTEYGDYMELPQIKGLSMHGSCYFDVDKSYASYKDISEKEFETMVKDTTL